MYSYTWDETTGGLQLNSSQLNFSKEPRPVYYKELDILGFDKHWIYQKDDTYPYMWAEANNYYYRGRLVAKTKGGSMGAAPEIILVDAPEPEGVPLRFVDIHKMVENNLELLDKLVKDSIKKVYNTYIDYRDKVDVFYVAFSGGKDSVVTLDIVQRAIPHNKFMVLFGDTGMEFPDTYDTVSLVEEECKQKQIEFIRASSKYDPDYTWTVFGPPATVTRWCCSVHKTAPQVLALREITQKPNFTGMAFIGVRASESLSRSDYDYVSLGEKHRGQYSCNPILEWNSAELYLYIFSENLILNEAYKKGNRRAGCLVCPRAAERNDYMSRICYKTEFDRFLHLISDQYQHSFNSKTDLENFIYTGGWKARKNGRDIIASINYKETQTKNDLIIDINNPRTNWKEWIKTIGPLLTDTSPFVIDFRNQYYQFELSEDDKHLQVKIPLFLTKTAPTFVKALKNVFKKAACCVLCDECTADCQRGYIHTEDGLFIDDRCIHCLNCHKVEKGCLVYKSLEMPKGGLAMMANKSLNCYSHHAPKLDWFNQYFMYKNDFDQNHTLGKNMYSFFKRFLRDSELLDENGFSSFASVLDSIGLDNPDTWALMLCNLAYTPQINWIIKRITFNELYSKEYVISLLLNDGVKESWVNDVWSSYSRLVELPFSVVGLGEAQKDNKNRMTAVIRSPWASPSPSVILYSLYKFAEACGNYYQFTLSRLLDHEVDSDGMSPTQIFGTDGETMKRILNGLSINYPEYITAQFNLDLDSITLNAEKSSKDVLELF